ncbi:MAG: hypothetical protein Q9211_004944 [Gyalolechia sp. 1 TL-2023]
MFSDQVHSCYKVLGLQSPRPDGPAASQQEIRIAYRRALLLNHPDKRQFSDSVQDPATPYTIDEVTRAFKVLVDRTHRLQHSGQGKTDREVGKPGIETVDLDELDYDDGKNEWRRDCRCGDAEGFKVTEDGLHQNCQDGEVIASCPGCSLHLKVTFVLNETG